MEEWFNKYIEVIGHLYAKKKKESCLKSCLMQTTDTLSQSSLQT